jgi:hypothetical protein
MSRQTKQNTIDELCDKLVFQYNRLTEARDELNHLDYYLRSSKFNEDTTVQVSDILLRIQDLRTILFRPVGLGFSPAELKTK